MDRDPNSRFPVGWANDSFFKARRFPPAAAQHLSDRVANSCGSEGTFIRTAAGAAFQQFSINDNRWNRVNAQSLCANRNVIVLHIEDRNLAGLAHNPFNQLHCLLTHRTSSTVNTNAPFGDHA
jgi:hypothetical protein